MSGNGLDKVLAHLQEARAALLEERDSGKGSRELSVALTEIDTAILWRQHDFNLKAPAVNAVWVGKTLDEAVPASFRNDVDGPATTAIKTEGAAAVRSILDPRGNGRFTFDPVGHGVVEVDTAIAGNLTGKETAGSDFFALFTAPAGSFVNYDRENSRFVVTQAAASPSCTVKVATSKSLEEEIQRLTKIVDAQAHDLRDRNALIERQAEGLRRQSERLSAAPAASLVFSFQVAKIKHKKRSRGRASASRNGWRFTSG